MMEISCAGVGAASGVRAPVSARVRRERRAARQVRAGGVAWRLRSRSSPLFGGGRGSEVHTRCTPVGGGTREGDVEYWGPVQETGEDIAESSDLFKNKMAPETFACDPEDPTPDCDGGKFITPDGHVYRRPSEPKAWVLNSLIILGKPMHWWFTWIFGGHRRPGLLLPLFAGIAIYYQHWWTVAICAIWLIGM